MGRLGARTVGRRRLDARVVELRNKKFSEHDAALDELAERYRPAAIWMDQTGMGEKPVEDAIRRYGESVVTGCIFSSPRRLDLATALRTRAQDRKVRIPAGDRQLRADLHSIKRMAGQTGPPRLVVDDEARRGEEPRRPLLGVGARLRRARGARGRVRLHPVRAGGADADPRDDDVDEDLDDDARGDRWRGFACEQADWRAA